MTEAFNMPLFIAILITLSGQILYHVIARKIGDDGRPWEAIAVAYLVAFLVVTTVGSAANRIHYSSVFGIKNIAFGCAVGIAVICVELGYVYAYRNGLSPGYGALTMLTLATLFLAPFSHIVLGEVLSLKIIFGAILAILGVWLMIS